MEDTYEELLERSEELQKYCSDLQEENDRLQDELSIANGEVDRLGIEIHKTDELLIAPLEAFQYMNDPNTCSKCNEWTHNIKNHIGTMHKEQN